ncbi:MAG: sulfatase-like hydrolase/transferase [Acidobacteria bacterium]|nr:sulfatase-like hydrolase/transferase [Acidobacteriota bacterium]
MRLKFGKSFLHTVMVSAFFFIPKLALAAQGKTTPPYNIILLTPDQLRADFMHTYGYPYPDTPNIDQLASEGTAFTRMYAGAPWTTPSFGVILTGLFPTVHGMTLPPYEGCGPSISRPLTNGEIPTVPSLLLLSPYKLIIPEVLKKDGMVAAVDDANCWSIWDVVNRGWDDFKFFPGYQLPAPGHPGSSSFYLTAPKTTAWAEQWLTAHRDQRFFFWIHYMEPHAPYNEPAAYDRFKTPDDFPNEPDGRTLHSLAKLQNIHAIRRLQELYAGKILYMDHFVGQLLNTVHTLGLDKNTIIILTSDHGQLLYSHPKDFNTDDHRSLYNADLHVPLIFRGPGIPSGKRLEDLASNYDILPTILDLENLLPPAHTDGVSLKGIIQGTTSEPPNHYLYCEESNLTPQYSIRNLHYKLIETMPTGKIQCFDEATDPRELHNICAQIPEEAAKLKAALDLHIQLLIRQAKSYPDWRNNLALAVLDQRDSKALNMLAPHRLIVAPTGGSHYQLTGRAWSIVKGLNKFGNLAYWAPPGPATAYVIWRSDTPLIGEYEISVWYGGTGQIGMKQATDADYTVRFKGGSLSFPFNQNEGQGEWHSLGSFHDPASVELTNRADGAVVAGAVRFVRVQQAEVRPASR